MLKPELKPLNLEGELIIFIYFFFVKGNAYLAIIEFGFRRIMMKNSSGRAGCYPSEICRIPHILRKPNSMIALLFIQNIFFAQTCKPSRSHFALC